MSQPRLEIRITKDASLNDIDIQAMSLKAAQSFLILLQSVTRIVELTPNNDEITLEIKPGSVVLAAEGKQLKNVRAEFEKILDNKSTNKDLVDQWRKIQSLFTANGLQYDACFYEQGKKIPFYETLKKREKLRARSIARKKFQTELEFLTGKLIAVGGKHPNIHVEVEGKTLPPIGCTEINATKAKAYLYQTIRFSAWAKKAGNDNSFRLCDSYATDEIYEELMGTIKDIFAADQIEALKKLHFHCRHYLDNQLYGKFRKLIRLFNDDSTDINMLKMILIVTQSVHHHERLNALLQTTQEIFDKKFKQLNKKTKR
jgi:phosphohistidine swiveling domain-containing protein